MRSLVVNESKFNFNNCVRNGSEAAVFRYGPQLMLKKFYKNDQELIINKLNKILILNAAEYDFLVKPEYLAIDNKKHLLGYIMNKVNYGKYENLMDIAYDPSLDLIDKIDIIKRLELKVLTLNHQDIFVFDYNPTNFMFDDKHSIRFIDTDNYMVEDYKPDCIASNYGLISEFEDCPWIAERFCFMMCALDILGGFKYDSLLFKDCDSIDMLKTILKEAKFPKELNSYVNKILNQPKKADIFSPILENMDLTEYNTTRSRI